MIGFQFSNGIIVSNTGSRLSSLHATTHMSKSVPRIIRGSRVSSLFWTIL